ncbi:MAG: elongation factor P [Coriobacteriia bacterium]|nr:elongation factor P [Coriobacteriia bacterium]
MAISTPQFKNGLCIMHEGKRKIIVEFQHVKPGKGPAFVRTKLKELESGRLVEYTFRPQDKFDDVRVEKKKMQYLYHDGTAYHFMDTSTYEQVELDSDFIGDAAQWLLENAEVEVLTADGEMIGVEAPMFVELTVTETEPGFKGDTVQGGTKAATLETGAVVQVPMFINVGEKLQIDTREGGRYIKRA